MNSLKSLKNVSTISENNLSVIRIHSLGIKGCLSLFHHSIDMRTDVNLSISCRKNMFCWNKERQPLVGNLTQKCITFFREMCLFVQTVQIH